MMKIHAIVMMTAVMVGTMASANEAGNLTVPEMARTASFVYKAEMLLGCKHPFGIHQGERPKEYEAFLIKWLSEDISGMGESESGQIQKKRMNAFLTDLHFLLKDNPNPKWKEKTVEEIADLLSSDLRSIASAAAITLEVDKDKTQNKPSEAIQ